MVGSSRKAGGLVAILFAALLSIGWGNPVNEESARGIEAYHGEEYDQALEHFLDAEEENPDLPVLRFNTAAALYQVGRFEDALAEYSSAAQDQELAAPALYGAGNSLLALERPDEAIAAYKEALRIDPGDQDTKHNLELALQMQKQQQEQQQQSGDEENEQEQGEDQQQQDSGEEENQQEEQQEPQSGEDQEEQRPDEEQEPEPQPPDGEMSQEDAERILEALADEEEEQRKKSLDKRKSRQKSNGKDW